MSARLRSSGRIIARALGRLASPPVAVVAAACLLIAGLYSCNRDMGGDPRSARGDGVYRPVLARGDGHMLYLMARSTVLDGDWRFDNDLARFGDPWGQPRTKTGRKGIPHPIGPALIWAPVLALAHGGALIANRFGAEIPEHGYTSWHQRIVFFTSVLFGCGAALLGLAVARRWVGGRWAPIYGAVAVLLGTSVTYYATHMPSYGHAMDAFFCAAFLAVWALGVGRRDWQRFAGLGALLGLAALVRTQELAMGVVVALELMAAMVALAVERRPGWLAGVGGLAARGAVTLAVALLVFSPQLLEWQIVFGDWRGLPQGAKFTRWGSPMLAELLFSSRNGWLATTPIAYAGWIGLLFLPRRARLVAAGLFLVVLVQVYLGSVVFDWWSGASFGQRRLCNVTLPIVVGLAALVAAAGRGVARWRPSPAWWHLVAVVGLGWLVVWNLARVWELRGGKAANSEPGASCCGGLPAPLAAVARPIYRAIGNPFAWPASALFAARYRVPLSRWDTAVGGYALIPPLNSLADGSWRRQRTSWTPGEPLVLRGLGAVQRRGRSYRWTTAPRAEIVVPILMPDPQRFAVWLAPGGAREVTLRWNGEVVAGAHLPEGWSQVSFEVREVSVGSNLLTVEAPLGEVGATLLLRPDGGRAGVAVAAVDISFL